MLECFIEWVSFSEEGTDRSVDTAQQSLFSGTFLELCLKVLRDLGHIENPYIYEIVYHYHVEPMMFGCYISLCTIVV